MDLETLRPSERLVEILHPANGKPIGLKVNIISLNDDRVSPIKREIRNRKLMLESRGKYFKSEDIDTNEEELLLACITGWVWENDLTFHGEKPEFTPLNVKKVLKEFSWIKAQIMESIGDEKAFFIG